MKKQSENPDEQNLLRFRQKFYEVFQWVSNSFSNDNIFRLARRNFSTSMFDAIIISLSECGRDVDKINATEFLDKIEKLKLDVHFKHYSGSASSNATNIREKIKAAKRIFFDS